MSLSSSPSSSSLCFLWYVCAAAAKWAAVVLVLMGGVGVGVGAATTTTLVDNVCKKTSDYDFCTTTLLSDPRSSTDDPRALAKVALEMTSTEARVTKEYIKQLLNRGIVPGTRGNVLRCDFEYNGALTTLQSALNDLSVGSYKELSLLTVLVHGNANTCERGFIDGHQTSPLTSQNNKLMSLSDICTAVFTFLNN